MYPKWDWENRDWLDDANNQSRKLIPIVNSYFCEICQQRCPSKSRLSSKHRGRRGNLLMVFQFVMISILFIFKAKSKTLLAREVCKENLKHVQLKQKSKASMWRLCPWCRTHTGITFPQEPMLQSISKQAILHWLAVMDNSIVSSSARQVCTLRCLASNILIELLHTSTCGESPLLEALEQQPS